MLGVEDRLAINDLYARYCACLDGGDWEAWSRCFTEDAVFTGFQEIRGRAAIAAYGRMRCEERPGSPWKMSQHWNNNLIVEGDACQARALCYIVTIGTLRDGIGSQLKVQGAYDDELEKQDGHWLFRRRTTRFDEMTPERIPART